MLKHFFLLFILSTASIDLFAAPSCKLINGTQSTSEPIPSVNMTLSDNIPDFTQLYYFARSNKGGLGLCTGATTQYALTLTNLPGGTTPYIRVVNGLTHYIYPTSINGLGISVFGNDPMAGSGDKNKPIKAYPDTTFKFNGAWSAGVIDLHYYAWLWKIPGKLGQGTETTGELNFVGPEITQVIGPSPTQPITTPNPERLLDASKGFLIINSLIPTGTVNLKGPTCNLSSGKTVLMGTWHHSAVKRASPWVNADFTLICPKAYGYNTLTANATSNPANNTRNANLTLMVVPRTNIMTHDFLGNLIEGTIALNGSGASGYGIQLAWGDRSTLSESDPANPVTFNVPVLASTINNQYQSGYYALGQEMPSPVIKMSARYIRTGTTISPGPANSMIEIIMNYN